MFMAKRYHDKEWLKREYVDERKTTTEIAEQCGVTGTTISDWLHRHDIGTRDQSEAQLSTGKHTDKEWLRKEYIDNYRSMKDIGDECGVTSACILKWLRKFDIETRTAHDFKKNIPLGITTDGPFGKLSGGYRYVQSKIKKGDEYDRSSVGVHQLIAIAEGADPHKVFTNGEYHCHHKNGIKWDNRPDNIELTTREEHMSEHNADRERTLTGEWV